MDQDLEAFIARWASSGAAERANKDSFLNELCDVLGVARPNPTTNDLERDGYVFERKVPLVHEDSDATLGSIDLYKQGCFILEAKQAAGEGASKLGRAKRGTPAWNILMKDAYGQALGYARSFDRPPPFIIVCDIGHCFDLYAAFDGSGDYQAFPNAQKNRFFLREFDSHRDTLRAIFESPLDLDPSKHAARVTREVAGHIAALAKRLEDNGHDQTLVAQFLMRCLFTMFAEDVGLLPEGLFTRALKDLWLPHPDSFPGGVEDLWKKMNEGGALFGVAGKILRFNGGLFASPHALKLDERALELLRDAAVCNWSDVEPAIFGTLLERALDPKERHALGAHYTPRAYVERLVRPTIEEPLRADWDVVQAQVRGLVVASEQAKTPKVAKDKVEEAKAAVRAFHVKLCHTRVLDPACGSGNFLYVTLDLFKRLEGEVLGLLESLGEKQTLMHLGSVRVTPEQFHGIEVKRWAKEIAELVLWIGYLQWHFRLYGKSIPVPEPVLRDYKNIECRDAVLAWDGDPELVRDASGEPVTRWDGESMKLSPVTGENVPDETRRVPVYRYKNPRKADWPEADFIVGNPPFVGNKRMRLALGDGYVEALRSAYPDVPEATDYVMYWWHVAAQLVGRQAARRAGLITTNSITQTFNRKVLSRQLDAPCPVSLVFAIPDHPWVDTESGADVRIAMSTGAPGHLDGTLLSSIEERPGPGGEIEVRFKTQRGRIHPDLSIGAAVTTTVPLQANQDMCQQGVKLVAPRDADGFVVQPADLISFGGVGEIIKPYVTNKDIVQRATGRFVIDFFGRSETQARIANPKAFQRVLDQVKPFRDSNRDPQRRRDYWLFGRSNERMRQSIGGLARFIVTPEVSKHRPFLFVPTPTVADASLYVIGSDDPFLLGVLSSKAHLVWFLATCGRMGVGNDPRYENGPCFLPYPFPACSDAHKARVSELAESLDAHRKRQQAEHPDLTITGTYNVLEKLRSGDDCEPLSAKEKVIHEQGLVSVLKKLHDDLDAAVFDAYGWPHDLTDEQILERLVALNAERAAEERRGLVRWLRPDFQNPSGARPATQQRLSGADDVEEPAAGAVPAAAATWPKKLPEQIAAVRDLVGKGATEWTVADVAAAFKGARKVDVEEVLDSLAALGILAAFETRRTRRWKATRPTG